LCYKEVTPHVLATDVVNEILFIYFHFFIPQTCFERLICYFISIQNLRRIPSKFKLTDSSMFCSYSLVFREPWPVLIFMLPSPVMTGVV